MELADLHLLHMPKHGAIACGAQPFSASGRALVLDTCLRRVAVTASGPEAARLSRFGELLQGVAAYQFLLELAAGLKSAVVGESEILGQLRSAWSAVEGSSSRLAEELSPVMQRLFADVKEVRERYLRGAGGQSYGSLLRKILHSTASGPTLLVGAGQLAASIVPYLPGSQVWIWNRSVERAREVCVSHARGRVPPVQVLEPTLEAELAAWRSAETVIVCVPEDPERDAARIAAWRAQARPNAQIAHLGLLSAKNTVWEQLPELLTLESLIACDRAHVQLRSERVLLARRFCAERARLRDLGRSVSIAHGWEDLALFQGLIEIRAEATLSV
jgi:hypothetical protein